VIPGHQVYGRVTLPYGEQVLWPDLCLKGTPSAAFHSALEIPTVATVVWKGIHGEIDSYSAFFENDRQTPVGLDTHLREANAGEIVLAGLAPLALAKLLAGGRCKEAAEILKPVGYDVRVLEPGDPKLVQARFPALVGKESPSLIIPENVA